MAVRYVSNAARGTGDGSSWANAASIWTGLNAQLALAGPSGNATTPGEVVVDAEVVYHVTGNSDTPILPITTQVGTSTSAPAAITGRRSNGAPGLALFQGDRPRPFGPTPTSTKGGCVFGIGVNYVRFENFEFRDVGDGCWKTTAPVTGIRLYNWRASNVRRGLFVTANNPITNLRMKQGKVFGNSKAVCRFDGGSSDVIIEQLHIDGDFQYNDQTAAAGIVLQTAANHDFIFRDIIIRNQWEPVSAGYWQGDGITTESADYNITFERVSIYGDLDGGFDLKSTNTVLRNCHAEGNKRNYRIWGEANAYNCSSIKPGKNRSANVNSTQAGSDRHIYLSDTAFLRWHGGVLDHGSSTADMCESDGGDLELDGGVVIKRRTGVVFRTGGGDVFFGTTNTVLDTE